MKNSRKKLKISIITVVKNGMPFLRDAIQSFEEQNYKNKEQIIIASPSTDGTAEFLNKKLKKNQKIIFEKKSNGIYKAINLGIKNCTGDVVGILHADDFFYNKDLFLTLNNIFKEDERINLIYGNIAYVDRINSEKIKRFWQSDNFIKENVYKGWMPPHTSMFIKKNLMIENFYSSKYIISSDYKFILDILTNKKTFPKFCNKTFIIMRSGGVSNKHLYLKFKEDINILINKKMHFSIIFLKIFKKIPQIFFKKKLTKIRKTENLKFKYYKNSSDFYKKNLILSCLNLTHLGFWNKTLPDKKFLLWSDSIFSFFLNKKLKKTPRHLLIKKIIQLNYSCFYVIGNFNKQNKDFLKDYCNDIIHVQTSYGSSEEIFRCLKNIKFKNNSLIIITLPTPKQELIAKRLAEQFQNDIVCIGGGLNIASGYEKACPHILSKCGFEFLWKLRSNTKRRVKKLLLSLISIVINFKILKKCLNQAK